MAVSTGVYLSDETLARVRAEAEKHYRGKLSAWIADAVERKLASIADPEKADTPLSELAARYLPARETDIKEALKGHSESKIATRLLDALADLLEEGREDGIDIAKRLEGRNVSLTISFEKR